MFAGEKMRGEEVLGWKRGMENSYQSGKMKRLGTLCDDWLY